MASILDLLKSKGLSEEQILELLKQKGIEPVNPEENKRPEPSLPPGVEPVSEDDPDAYPQDIKEIDMNDIDKQRKLDALRKLRG